MNNRYFYIIIFFLISSIRLFIIPLQTGDLAIWIAHGVNAIETGRFLTVDIFSVHNGLGFIYPARLTNLLLGYLYNYIGLDGIYLFIRLNFVAVFTFVYLKYVRGKITTNLYNYTLLIVAMLGLTFPMDRPQALITVFALLVFDYIVRENLKTRNYILFFIYCLLWNNIHSSVFILLPVVFWKLIISIKCRKQFKSSVLIFLLFMISTFMTNAGFHIYEYIYQTIIISSIRGITEWGNIFNLDYPAQTCLYVFSLVMIIYMAYNRGKHRDLFFNPLFPLLFVGMVSVRNTYWLFIIIIPLISNLDMWNKQSDTYFNSLWKNIIVICCICWLMTAFSPFISRWEYNNWGYSKDTPVKIIRDINTKKIELRIFNQWELGSALALLQKNKIFIDSRNIIYPDNIFNDYWDIIRGQNSLELLSKYKMNAIIIKNESFPLANILKETPSWMIISVDENFLYFRKKVSQDRFLLE